MKNWHVNVGLLLIIVVTYLLGKHTGNENHAELKQFVVARYAVDGWSPVWIGYQEENVFRWRILPDEYKDWADNIQQEQVKQLPPSFYSWDVAAGPEDAIPVNTGSVNISSISFYAYVRKPIDKF